MINIFSGNGGATDIIFSMMKTSKDKKILIVPELFSHRYELKVLKDGITNIEVLTFSSIIRRLFETLGGLSNVFLNDAGKIIVVHKAIGETNLKTIKNSNNIKYISNTIARFKAAKITSEDILRASELCSQSLSNRLLDIAYIYIKYSKICLDNMADENDKFDDATAKINKSDMFKNADIYIDSFTGFTKQEMDMLAGIFKLAKSVNISIISGDADIFNDSKQTIKYISEKYTQCVINPINQTNSNINPFVILGDSSDSENINLYIAQDIFSECEFVLGTILRLIKEEGYKFSDFTVSAKDFSKYNEIFAVLSENYAVPIYLTQRTNILDKSLFTLIFAVLDIILYNFNLDDMIKYIKTGLTGLSLSEAYILESYAQSVNINGKAWLEDFDVTDILLNDENINDINSIRQKLILPIVNLKQNIKKCNSALDYSKAIYQFCEHINITHTIGDIADRLANTQARDEYLKAYDVFISALEQFTIIEHTDINLEKFIALLKNVLSVMDIGTIPALVDMVYAGDLVRNFALPGKVSFILGVNDDMFTDNNMGIFTGKDAGDLIGAGLEFIDDYISIKNRDEFLIYKAILMTRDKVFISYKKVDISGEAMYPAHIINNMKNTNIILEDLGFYRSQAPKPCFQLACNPTGVYGQAAYEYYKNTEKFKQILEFSKKQNKILAQDRVKRLYGEKLKLSASKIGMQASCRFAFFMQYGLRAKKRRKYDMDSLKMGNFIHFVLENVIPNISDDMEFNKKLTDKYIKLYVSEFIGDMSKKTARFRYIFNKLCEQTYKILENIIDEINSSDFKPLDFELEFGENAQLPAIDISINAMLEGKIDRVDGYIKDNKLYIRVLDYKSSKKSINLTDIYNGINLQMLIYLFALKKISLDRYKKLNNNIEDVLPASALYIQSKIPVKNSQQELLKHFQRDGIILDDTDIIKAMEKSSSPKFLPIKFNVDGSVRSSSFVISPLKMVRLSNFIDKKLKDLADEISFGDVSENPYVYGSDSSCTYCEYKQACHFDENIHSPRYLPKVSDENFWKEIWE